MSNRNNTSTDARTTRKSSISFNRGTGATTANMARNPVQEEVSLDREAMSRMPATANGGGNSGNGHTSGTGGNINTLRRQVLHSPFMGKRQPARVVMPGLQLKSEFTVGQEDCPAEQEAEHVSREVMAGRARGISIGANPGGSAALKSAKSKDGGTVPIVSPGIASSIRSMQSSGGSPLPKAELKFHNERFGRDFSHVRVHRGPKADEINEHLNSASATIGQTVIESKKAGVPGSYEQSKTMAHELTHTVQNLGKSNGSPGREVIRRFIITGPVFTTKDSPIMVRINANYEKKRMLEELHRTYPNISRERLEYIFEVGEQKGWVTYGKENYLHPALNFLEKIIVLMENSGTGSVISFNHIDIRNADNARKRFRQALNSFGSGTEANVKRDGFIFGFFKTASLRFGELWFLAELALIAIPFAKWIRAKGIITQVIHNSSILKTEGGKFAVKTGRALFGKKARIAGGISVVSNLTSQVITHGEDLKKYNLSSAVIDYIFATIALTFVIKLSRRFPVRLFSPEMLTFEAWKRLTIQTAAFKLYADIVSVVKAYASNTDPKKTKQGNQFEGILQFIKYHAMQTFLRSPYGLKRFPDGNGEGAIIAFNKIFTGIIKLAMRYLFDITPKSNAPR